MILLLANSYIKEHFNNDVSSKDKSNENENEYENEIINYNYHNELLIFFIYLAISVVAVYLSWTCNTKANYPMSVKIACAINAYTFGIFYIIYYFIAVSGKCDKGLYVDFDNSKLDVLIDKLSGKKI
jgi:hypothetical protein